MHSGFTTIKRSPEELGLTVTFQFDSRHYQINTNSQALIAALEAYFSGYESHSLAPDVTLYFFEDEKLTNHVDWKNWSGEVGKTRLKEQYCDAVDGRWIHKFKTGMVMFQHVNAPLAIGPCTAHLSQIINFIINQHINFLQQEGGLICHAACINVGGTGIAIAAHSGGGKSTTMLKLMDLPDSRFISNDRLFLFTQGNQVTAKGVPKQPRVNPGTLLNNSKLKSILPSQRQSELNSLSRDALWQREEKYDVMVADIYGKKSQALSTPLQHIILLNWQPNQDVTVSIRAISLDERPDLIAALAKSPGSFYQDKQGQFLHSATRPSDERYQEAIREICVWEVCGGADFDALLTLIKKHLL